MTKLDLDISMSLDGFVTGPGEGVEKPLGDDGGRLHGWMFDGKTDADAEFLDEIYATTAAVREGAIPVLLGEGVRHFEGQGSERIALESTRTIETPSATHLRFTVLN